MRGNRQGRFLLAIPRTPDDAQLIPISESTSSLSLLSSVSIRIAPSYARVTESPSSPDKKSVRAAFPSELHRNVAIAIAEHVDPLTRHQFHHVLSGHERPRTRLQTVAQASRAMTRVDDSTSGYVFTLTNLPMPAAKPPIRVSALPSPRISNCG